MNASNETFLNAIWKGDMSAVQDQLDQGIDINMIDFKTDNHMTALMLALKAGHQEVARLLVSKGVNVNALDNKGNTALWYVMGNAETAKLLISAGIDVNTKNGWGISPLSFYSNFSKNDKIVELLRSAGAKQ
jgi:ankyrin repeat protein